MNNDKISIIMSVYNENSNYIIDSVESIINQTYKNLEIIIVLDCPKNIAAKNIINKYANKDSRIVIIENIVNKGLVASLNSALQICTGKYIARMDADDISDTRRIEKQLKYIKLNNIDILGCKIQYIDMKNQTLDISDKRAIYNKDVKKELRYINSLAHPTWMVKENVYRELQGYRDFNACEDYDFLLRASSLGYKIENINEKLLKYRINENGISTTNGIKQFIMANYLRKNIRKINSISEERFKEFYINFEKSPGYINYERDKEQIKELMKKNSVSNIFKLLKIINNNRVLKELLNYKVKIKILT